MVILELILQNSNEVVIDSLFSLVCILWFFLAIRAQRIMHYVTLGKGCWNYVGTSPTCVWLHQFELWKLESGDKKRTENIDPLSQ